MSLFLGFPLRGALHQRFLRLDPRFVKLFVGPPEGLEQAIHEGTAYLGKSVPSHLYMDVEQLAVHVRSFGPRLFGHLPLTSLFLLVRDEKS